MPHWYRELIRLRKARPGDPAKASVRWDTRQLWLTMTCAGQRAVFNFSPDPQEIPVPEGEWILSLFSDGAAHGDKGPVPGHGTRIYSSAASGI
ncbi:MAG: DUF3459 domain-containing protein [Verrucomicrobiota bacterium]